MHQRIPISIPNSNIIYISNTKIDESFTTIQHSHPNLEIILIYNGSGYIKTNDSTIQVKSKDLIIINPKTIHIETTNNELSFFAIGLAKLSIYSKEYSKKGFAVINQLSNFEELLLIYKTIFNEINFKNDDYQKIIINMLDTLLIMLKRYLCNVENNDISQFDSNIVSLIKNYIDSNYSKNITLDDLAKLSNSSVSYICHLFKKKTNQSIIDYKITKQLQEAKNLIEITDMNINQISLFVGFSNQSYFNKLFKSYFNATPKQIRLNK